MRRTNWIIASTLWFLVSLTVIAQEDNQELLSFFESDQKERKEHAFTVYSDQERLERVKEIITEGGLITTSDYYHAAMIFQHGQSPEDFKQANRLALKAVEIDSTNKKAKWLACAAEDRYLLRIGKAQVWGTQYISLGDGLPYDYRMPYDKEAKTEEQKRANGVATLEEVRKYLDSLKSQAKNQ